MINELYGLAQALKGAEVSTEVWHKDYKPLPNVTPKAPLARIWLGETGISGIESVPPELAATLRKYGSNQGTFPAMNLVPLYRITAEDDKKLIERMKKVPASIDLPKVRALCTAVNINWTKKFLKKYKVSLYNVPQEVQAMLAGSTSPVSDEVGHLIELLHANYPVPVMAKVKDEVGDKGEDKEDKKEKLPDSFLAFHDALADAAFTLLENHENEAFALSVLFHLGNADKKAEDDTGGLSAILDISDWKLYGYPVAGTHFTKEFNQALLEHEANVSASQTSTMTDAFKMPHVPNKAPMPSIKLAAGFEAKIYTMFSDQFFQDRYGNFSRDDKPYPLSAENRTAFASALAWATGTDQKGKTWLNTGKDEALIVYPSILPAVPMQFTAFFGTVNKDIRFAEQAGNFIRTLNGLPAKAKPDHIYVFVLRKLDKARTKVLYSRETDPQKLVRAAERWQVACQNRPPISRQDALESIYPLDVSAVMNRVWHMDRNVPSSSVTPIMKPYQGIELLLGGFDRSMLTHFLGAIVRNSLRFTGWYGNICHSGKRGDYQIYNQEQELLKSITVIGILLYQLDYRKEYFMESYPFLLGRMLQISDCLHALYCEVMRKGDLPTQLAGSSLYNIAADLPLTAFSQLGARMNPYLTWATSYCRKNEEKSKLVGWYMHQYRETADSLVQVLTDQTHFNDYEKAQLMLGYLGSLKNNNSNEEEAK